MSQASATGPLVYLTPFALFLGYVGIAFYYRSLAYTATPECPNLYYLLGGQSRSPKPLTSFGRWFGIFMAITYVLLLAYELKVGGTIIVNSLLQSPTPEQQLGFGVFIFLTVAIYTSLAGLRAAVDTDVVQFVFILIFVALIPQLLPASPTVPRIEEHHTVSNESILAAVLAIATAITTQFYSIVNPQVGCSHSSNTQFKIFLGVGVLSGAVYAVVAYIGIQLGSTAALEEIIRKYVYSDAPSHAAVFFLFAGMLAVLMSTLDNVTVSVSQLVYENLFRKSEDKALQDIRLLRVSYFLTTLVVVAVALTVLTYYKNIFYLLLTILFAATVLSPIVFTAIFLRASGRETFLSNSRTVGVLVVLIVLAWPIYAYLSLTQPSSMGTTFHLAALTCACIWAGIDYVKNRFRFVSQTTEAHQ
ncbi:MAG: hypothetical protein J5X22_00595 [Candidatus Accumulibacter sp.]|uniref:hypothetical protein n=1 Tax=Accumulibacter sp. TaxID=2053492 RepID=UPI001B296A6B|nr:hypothetical protein [Accumulibacter sp.]MBO3709058.1 hypothetical protein [Accumulibacter sp.]